MIIAIFNQAGGVGKSTLSMNLGYELHSRGRKTLLLDMDQQGSLTDFFGIESADIEFEDTIGEAIRKGQSTIGELPIRRTEVGVDLIPAGWDLGDLELELAGRVGREWVLGEALAEVKDIYEYIILDCPPSRSIIPYVSLCAASHVLVPVETQYKALKATVKLFKMYNLVRKYYNCELEILGFVPFKYDSRRNMDRRSLRIIQEELPQFGKVMEPVPLTTALSDASEEHLPLALFKSSHNQNSTQRALEVLRHIGDIVESQGM